MIKHHEKEIAKTDVFEHQHSSTKRTLFFGRVIRIGPISDLSFIQPE